MTITEECELHEMIGCRICNPKPEYDEPDSRPFPARYDGQCPQCNLSILVGQSVILVTSRSGYRAAVHKECV